MSEEIKNLGAKGRGFLWFLVYFLCFIVLLIYLYQRNFAYLPVVGQ